MQTAMAACAWTARGVWWTEVIANALRVTLLALDLAGNHGTSRRDPLERHHRDVLCGRNHSPHNALIRGTLGRRGLGSGT